MMRRLAVLVLSVAGFASAAEALTIRDVIELARAGLGEEVLLALVEVDGSVYAIDPATLKSLKQAGVPERVIVAMVRSGRERLPEPLVPAEPVQDPRPPEPQVVVIHHEEPRVREVMVPVPVYVTVPVGRSRRHFDDRGVRSTIESTYVPFQSGLPVVRPAPEPKREPVYWGFGGKLRPDAWKPDGYKAEDPKSDKDKK
jgi:hypothetical protein